MLIDKMVMKNCKRRKTSLSMIWLDYKKAYDMIPHSWIVKCLDIYNIASNITAVIKNSMKQWNTELTSGNEKLCKIDIKRGIFQGDSLSPLLFVMCMMQVDLGVQVDNSLNWKEHIKTVSIKVSRAIGFLKHAKTLLGQETLKTLYTGIVEPHFRYYCSVWGCAGSTELNQLQKLQNRAARIITNSSFDTSSRPLIDKMGWKTIEQLVASESKTMVFKSLHELAPHYLCDLFTQNSKCSSYVLRNSETDVRLPLKSQVMGKNVFPIEEQKLGMTFLPIPSRQLP